LAVRSAALDTAVAQPHSLIVPARTLNELSRVLTNDQEMVNLSFPAGRSQVIFRLEAVEIVSQVLNGEYPDYAQIIPQTHSTAVQVPSGELLRACRYVETFARDNANTIRVYIRPGERAQAPGQMVVTGQSAEKGENQWPLEASVTGPGMDL